MRSLRYENSFSHGRSEQFWKQNTILSKKIRFFGNFLENYFLKYLAIYGFVHLKSIIYLTNRIFGWHGFALCRPIWTNLLLLTYWKNKQKIIISNQSLLVWLLRSELSTFSKVFSFFQMQHFKGTMKFQIRAIYWGWEMIGNS